MTTIYGECDAPNHGSARVMLKSGMKRVHEWQEGGTHFERYMMTRDEWQEKMQL